MVLPDEFIPAAERFNLMPSLDRWVIEKVLRDYVPSTRDGVEEAAFTVAINLSGTTLSDPSFLEFLIDALEAHEPTPGVLCFEVTETAAITNLGHASYLMREMASRGCLIALDDFGSGLSSFNYLRTLPVNYLKIDGKFVQNVATDPIDRSMVEAIVQIGRAIGIETVAERVETPAVLDTLASHRRRLRPGLPASAARRRWPYSRTASNERARGAVSPDLPAICPMSLSVTTDSDAAPRILSRAGDSPGLCGSVIVRIVHPL